MHPLVAKHYDKKSGLPISQNVMLWWLPIQIVILNNKTNESILITCVSF